MRDIPVPNGYAPNIASKYIKQKLVELEMKINYL